MKETLGGLMGRVDWVVATAWRRSQRDGAQINGASKGFDTTSMVGIRWAHVCVSVGSPMMGKTGSGISRSLRLAGPGENGNVPL